MENTTDKFVAKHIWAVAVDGSEASENTFYQCLNEFMQKSDKIYVISITDKNKHYLKGEYTPDQIAKKYKTILLANFTESHYKIVLQEKDYRSSIRTDILKVCDDINAHFLFFGYHGRKGPKDDPSIMGSTVKNAVSNSKVPLCVVKVPVTRKDSKTGGFTFLVCLDGSDKAYSGLDATLRLMNSPNDRILACTMKTFDSLEKMNIIKERALGFFSKHEINGNFMELEVKVKVMGEILRLVNENEKDTIDFVVVGNNGLRAQKERSVFLGSAAEALITQCIANVIIIP